MDRMTTRTTRFVFNLGNLSRDAGVIQTSTRQN